jgi:hypothetical protein
VDERRRAALGEAPERAFVVVLGLVGLFARALSSFFLVAMDNLHASG